MKQGENCKAAPDRRRREKKEKKESLFLEKE